MNDTSANFDAAQEIGGSLDIAIPQASADDFVISFLFPTRAFGFWVVNNNTFSIAPAFEARNTLGALIESVTFEGSVIDGSVGPADYGFLGIVADEDIGSVRITREATILDDLRFSSVPEPTTLSLLVFGGMAALRRRVC